MIISITNQKGGVGKTTTAANLGYCLSEINKKVLLIDLDPQAGLTISLGFNPETSACAVLDLLNGKKIEAQKTNIKNLFIFPSNLKLSTAEAHMIGKIGFETHLKKAIHKLAGFDFIIIDCPPSLGVLTANALIAANHVIIPVQCEYLSMRALTQLHKIISTAKEVNPHLTTKILMTMHDKRTIHSQEVISEIKKHFSIYKSIISRTIRFAYSSVVGKPLALMDKKSEQSKNYRKLMREVLNEQKTIN